MGHSWIYMDPVMFGYVFLRYETNYFTKWGLRDRTQSKDYNRKQFDCLETYSYIISHTMSWICRQHLHVFTEIRRCTLKPHSCFTTFLRQKNLKSGDVFSSLVSFRLWLVKSIYQVPQLHRTTPQSLRLRPYDSYDQGLWKPMKGHFP